MILIAAFFKGTAPENMIRGENALFNFHLKQMALRLSLPPLSVVLCRSRSLSLSFSVSFAHMLILIIIIHLSSLSMSFPYLVVLSPNNFLFLSFSLFVNISLYQSLLLSFSRIVVLSLLHTHTHIFTQINPSSLSFFSPYSFKPLSFFPALIHTHWYIACLSLILYPSSTSFSHFRFAFFFPKCSDCFFFVFLPWSPFFACCLLLLGLTP